jgi:exonuclease III
MFHTMSVKEEPKPPEDKNKRQKISYNGGDDDNKNIATGQSYPKTFVTWNCNGLTSRTRWNANDLQRLVSETKYPDMICLQEVRLKSSGPSDHQRGRPLDSEYNGFVQHVLEEQVFSDYQQFWSLADTKYAGTLTLIHRRCFENSNNMMGFSSSLSPDFVAFTPQSAIDLMLRRLGTTREECGFSPSLSAATSSISTPSSQKRTTQASLTSFFSPKKPLSLSPEKKKAQISLESFPPRKTSKATTGITRHHPEGRFQFFFFPDMDVIQTYVPNNGTKEESFHKRRHWDYDILQFFRDRRTILSKQTSGNRRKLLWCGDMNVALNYQDGSHWEERVIKEEERGGDRSSGGCSETTTKSAIYEWWTDESKCFVQSDNKSPLRNKRPEDIGMPSFTPAERKRFSSILQEADLCDVWRHLHPNGISVDCDNPTQTRNCNSRWDLPNYTWRGHLARREGNIAKYQGKGQRLDYFLLAPSHLVKDNPSSAIVKGCEILGYGEQKEGLFCGSDHCAVLLELK